MTRRAPRRCFRLLRHGAMQRCYRATREAAHEAMLEGRVLDLDQADLAASLALVQLDSIVFQTRRRRAPV